MLRKMEPASDQPSGGALPGASPKKQVLISSARLTFGSGVAGISEERSKGASSRSEVGGHGQHASHE